MTHTPGPWTANHDGDPIQIGTKSGRFVAMTLPDSDNGQDPTAEDYANASLIAAAPDLLAALRGVRDAHASIESCDMPAWLEAVEDALAQAEKGA